MAFLKNMSIKTTTKRVFSDFWSALAIFLVKNPALTFNEALQDYSFLRTVPVRGLVGKIECDASIFCDFLKNLPEDQKGTFELTFHIVWCIVCYELKYDKTIGTREDKELVYDLIENLVNQYKRKRGLNNYPV